MRTNGLKGNRAALVFAAFVLLSGAAAGSAVASDYFLDIDGIEGESTDARHAKEIEIESFSFGATAASTTNGGGRAGTTSFQDFHFNKKLDKSSPLLMKALALGTRIPKATLVLRKAGKDQQEYYKVTLENVVVTSYTVGGTQSSNTVPFDQFSVSFDKMTTSYSPQKADGTLDAPVTFTTQTSKGR